MFKVITYYSLNCYNSSHMNNEAVIFYVILPSFYAVKAEMPIYTVRCQGQCHNDNTLFKWTIGLPWTKFR